MIEVRHLTKRYGNHTAVKDLSFTIENGVIYGFLGPNGAGKSTTMNIITGCLGATDGEILIDGVNIEDDPMKAKKQIGYLPEQPPLYTEMTPVEYLRFVMEAKKIPHAKQAEELASVMEKTGITEVRSRLIKNLSKGYRQRVGIAQAILGNPEVIILDEPTVGLDPAQIIEIRELIRDLGRTHTIILSSHILSEVQAICDSIMIIANGELVASDTPENLSALFAGVENITIEANAAAERVEGILASIPGITGTEVVSESKETTVVKITPEKGNDLRIPLFKAFAKSDIALLELHRERASLEDIFLELTQSETVSADSANTDKASDTTPETENNEKEADDK